VDGASAESGFVPVKPFSVLTCLWRDCFGCRFCVRASQNWSVARKERFRTFLFLGLAGALVATNAIGTNVVIMGVFRSALAQEAAVADVVIASRTDAITHSAAAAAGIPAVRTAASAALCASGGLTAPGPHGATAVCNSSSPAERASAASWSIEGSAATSTILSTLVDSLGFDHVALTAPDSRLLACPPDPKWREDAFAAIEAGRLPPALTMCGGRSPAALASGALALPSPVRGLVHAAVLYGRAVAAPVLLDGAELAGTGVRARFGRRFARTPAPRSRDHPVARFYNSTPPAEQRMPPPEATTLALCSAVPVEGLPSQYWVLGSAGRSAGWDPASAEQGAPPGSPSRRHYPPAPARGILPPGVPHVGAYASVLDVDSNADAAGAAWQEGPAAVAPTGQGDDHAMPRAWVAGVVVACDILDGKTALLEDMVAPLRERSASLYKLTHAVSGVSGRDGASRGPLFVPGVEHGFIEAEARLSAAAPSAGSPAAQAAWARIPGPLAGLAFPVPSVGVATPGGGRRLRDGEARLATSVWAFASGLVVTGQEPADTGADSGSASAVRQCLDGAGAMQTEAHWRSAMLQGEPVAFTARALATASVGGRTAPLWWPPNRISDSGASTRAPPSQVGAFAIHAGVGGAIVEPREAAGVLVWATHLRQARGLVSFVLENLSLAVVLVAIIEFRAAFVLGGRVQGPLSSAVKRAERVATFAKTALATVDALRVHLAAGTLAKTDRARVEAAQRKRVADEKASAKRRMGRRQESRAPRRADSTGQDSAAATSDEDAAASGDRHGRDAIKRTPSSDGQRARGRATSTPPPGIGSPQLSPTASNAGAMAAAAAGGHVVYRAPSSGGRSVSVSVRGGVFASSRLQREQSHDPGHRLTAPRTAVPPLGAPGSFPSARTRERQGWHRQSRAQGAQGHAVHAAQFSDSDVFEVAGAPMRVQAGQLLSVDSHSASRSEGTANAARPSTVDGSVDGRELAGAMEVVSVNHPHTDSDRDFAGQQTARGGRRTSRYGLDSIASLGPERRLIDRGHSGGSVGGPAAAPGTGPPARRSTDGPAAALQHGQPASSDAGKDSVVAAGVAAGSAGSGSAPAGQQLVPELEGTENEVDWLVFFFEKASRVVSDRLKHRLVPRSRSSSRSRAAARARRLSRAKSRAFLGKARQGDADAKRAAVAGSSSPTVRRPGAASKRQARPTPAAKVGPAPAADGRPSDEDAWLTGGVIKGKKRVRDKL